MRAHLASLRAAVDRSPEPVEAIVGDDQAVADSFVTVGRRLHGCGRSGQWVLQCPATPPPASAERSLLAVPASLGLLVGARPSIRCSISAVSVLRSKGWSVQK